MGESLREYRRRAGLTQQEAADRAGLSVAGLRDIEQGRVVAPRPPTLRRLGVALGLSGTEVDELSRPGRRDQEPAGGVWFGVLGPLRMRVDGVVVDPGSETQRALLGLLALSPNAPVGRDSLRERAWGRPSPVGADALPTRISRLRRLMQPREQGEAPALVATDGGYQLTATADQLDLLAFRALVSRARRSRASGDPAAACDQFAAAAALWRGEPLAGLAVLADDPTVVGLARHWHSVVVEYAAVAAELGRHAEVLPLLRRVLQTDPWSEAAHARLMVALAGTGRPAEALADFDLLRRRLAAELGADPGPELVEVHRQVLRQQVTRPEVTPVTAYRQLPPDIADFVGRDTELRWLHERLPPLGATSAVVSIQGMGGVGKTRLAVHFAHQLSAAGRYADCQLYVDLQGHAAAPPADPAAVLVSFLHLLGVPGDQVPTDLAGRVALYRDQLRDRHALVLLDNAAGEEQLTPLLPAAPTCLVLTTSRRVLSLAGADTLRLDAFTRQEASDLLVRVVGPERVEVDPVSADRVTDLCRRLPLAVALAARRLQARPGWTLADLATRLADASSRLGELTAGGRRLGAVFDLSYHALPSATRRLFRLLGRHPGPDFTAGSVAALAGTTPQTARRTLDHLVDEHLVAVASGERYQLHDLLRDYARELAEQDGPDACREATRRVLGWYLGAADAAQQVLFPGRRVLAPDWRPGVPPPSFADDGAAFGWLEAEHTNLVAAVTMAADHRLGSFTWQLPAALRPYFERTGQWDDWIQAATTGLAAARRDRDRTGEAWMLNDLGAAYGHLDQLDRSTELFTRAVQLHRALGDAEHEVWGLNNLGVIAAMRGQLEASVDHLQRALQIVERLGRPALAARVLSNLGLTWARLGRSQDAIRCLRSAIEVPDHARDPVGFALSLSNLGEAVLRDGRPGDAIPLLREARERQRQQHARLDEAETLETLGQALREAGELAQARACWRQATTILRELRHPRADDLRARVAQLP